MNFLIRADASFDIGSGHIMRCLTLANALKKEAHQVHFICRNLPGNLIDTIQKAGFDCTVLATNTIDKLQNNTEKFQLAHADWLPVSQQQDITDCKAIIRQLKPDWIIVDHYALSKPWQKQAKLYFSCKIMVIDDLADRLHDADLLLDQNLGRSEVDYQKLLPSHCQMLLGPRYALLRPEFRQWRTYSLHRRSSHTYQHNNILVNFGGVDKSNHTLTILKILTEVYSDLIPPFSVTVVMGTTAPHIERIKNYAEQAPYPCRILVNIQNIAEVMSHADLAIGAAGSTSWERCCLGLPTLVLVLAENQNEIALQLQNKGVAIYLYGDKINGSYFKKLINANQHNIVWQSMGKKASRLVDGLGAYRVVHTIFKMK